MLEKYVSVNTLYVYLEKYSFMFNRCNILQYWLITIDILYLLVPF